VTSTTSSIRACDDRLDEHSDLPEEPLITAVTLAELSVGPLVAVDESERAARQARLQVTEASFDPLPFDASPVGTFRRVAAELRRSARTATAQLFDAMIAAMALGKAAGL
jgi:tRNA(fMet)-specific endonuclease VapC